MVHGKKLDIIFSTYYLLIQIHSTMIVAVIGHLTELKSPGGAPEEIFTDNKETFNTPEWQHIGLKVWLQTDYIKPLLRSAKWFHRMICQDDQQYPEKKKAAKTSTLHTLMNLRGTTIANFQLSWVEMLHNRPVGPWVPRQSAILPINLKNIHKKLSDWQHIQRRAYAERIRAKDLPQLQIDKEILYLMTESDWLTEKWCKMVQYCVVTLWPHLKVQFIDVTADSWSSLIIQPFQEYRLLLIRLPIPHYTGPSNDSVLQVQL